MGVWTIDCGESMTSSGRNLMSNSVGVSFHPDPKHAGDSFNVHCEMENNRPTCFEAQPADSRWKKIFNDNLKICDAHTIHVFFTGDNVESLALQIEDDNYFRSIPKPKINNKDWENMKKVLTQDTQDAIFDYVKEQLNYSKIKNKNKNNNKE